MLISGGGGGGETAPLQSVIDPDWIMFLIYKEQEVGDIDSTSTPSGSEVYSGNMWTRNGLIAIRDLEAPIRGSPEFNNFCWAD